MDNSSLMITAKDAEEFCRVHIKRCKLNLAGALDRKDIKAVAHLERKLAVYEYLSKLSRDSDRATECPQCRVTAMKNGICACCGYPNRIATKA